MHWIYDCKCNESTSACISWLNLIASIFGGLWTSDLRLTCGWHVTTSWVVSTVRYGPTNQANSALYLSWVGKWIVIRVITCSTGVETIKRQTRAAYGWLVVGQSAGTRLPVPLKSIASTPASFSLNCSTAFSIIGFFALGSKDPESWKHEAKMKSWNS